MSSVSSCLWDLRAKFEQQLRWLGDAQILVDVMRDHPQQTRAALAERVAGRLDQLENAALAIAEGVKDCREQVKSLPD